jgi:hypothetical protein
MKRRDFFFLASFGLFQLGEALGIDALDRAAAATINLRRRRAPSRPPVAPQNFVPAQPTAETVVNAPTPAPADDPEDVGEPGKPDAKRRARHGRPPSRWLRSLEVEELRTWLTTIDPPEAGVSGMTFWTHLTRDHFFDAAKLEGLTIDEQAKLHAAAHDGY